MNVKSAATIELYFLPFSNHCDAAVVYAMIEHNTRTYHKHKVYNFIVRSGIGELFLFIWYIEINLYSMRIIYAVDSRFISRIQLEHKHKHCCLMANNDSFYLIVGIFLWFNT